MKTVLSKKCPECKKSLTLEEWWGEELWRSNLENSGGYPGMLYVIGDVIIATDAATDDSSEPDVHFFNLIVAKKVFMKYACHDCSRSVDWDTVSERVDDVWDAEIPIKNIVSITWKEA